MNRRLFYETAFSARALFFAGFLILPALLFNPFTEFRVVQFLFFWFLVLFSGKKTNPLLTVLVIFIIIVFNVLVPYARVLFSIGAFKITSGALTAGIHRAVTLAALIMLSKVTIRQDLILPGAFGELLGESMRLFSAIISKKYRVTGRNVIVEIDNLLLELSEEVIPQTEQQIRTKPVGYFVLIAIIVVSWLPWVKVFHSVQ
jgi:heptaprenyl diphosphate synthase